MTYGYSSISVTVSTFRFDKPKNSLTFKNGENFRFIREKTKDRTRDTKRIYAPITPEMQSIIEKWGNNPRKSNLYISFYEAGDDAWEHEKKKKNLTNI